MWWLEFLKSDIANSLTLTLAHLLWQGLAVLAFFVLVMACRPSGTARHRYRIQVAALVLILICGVVTFTVLSNWEVHSTAWYKQFTDPIASYITVIYFAGVSAMLGRIMLAVISGRRLRSVSMEVTEPEAVLAIDNTAQKLGFRDVPVVGYCRHVSVPMVVGLRRPAVLLPVNLVEGTTPDQFRAIITHELIHIRRRDNLVLLVQRLIEAFLFFHPAVWYISWSMSAQRENACDDEVVANGNERFMYTETLLRVAELQLLGAEKRIMNGALAQSVARSPCQLRSRIARLIADRSKQ